MGGWGGGGGEKSEEQVKCRWKKRREMTGKGERWWREVRQNNFYCVAHHWIIEHISVWFNILICSRGT